MKVYVLTKYFSGGTFASYSKGECKQVVGVYVTLETVQKEMQKLFYECKVKYLKEKIKSSYSWCSEEELEELGLTLEEFEFVDEELGDTYAYFRIEYVMGDEEVEFEIVEKELEK